MKKNLKDLSAINLTTLGMTLTLLADSTVKKQWILILAKLCSFKASFYVFFGFFCDPKRTSNFILDWRFSSALRLFVGMSAVTWQLVINWTSDLYYQRSSFTLIFENLISFLYLLCLQQNFSWNYWGKKIGQSPGIRNVNKKSR